MWIRNVDLKRMRDSTGFDGISPLGLTIINNKWWRGPVDTWVISPEFEAIGHISVNDYLGNNRREDGTLESENYFLFLTDSLAGKFPGFGNTILTPEQPSQRILDVFRTPEYGHQEYTVVVIDTTAFDNGGTLTLDIELGHEKAHGGFHLLGADHKLTYDPDRKRPEPVMLSESHDIGWYSPCEIGQMTHRFDRGRVFKLVAWGAFNDRGSINAFYAKVSVKLAEIK